jgi:hypothetical protein
MEDHRARRRSAGQEEICASFILLELGARNSVDAHLTRLPGDLARKRFEFCHGVEPSAQLRDRKGLNALS